MRKRTITLRVGERLRSKPPTKRQGSRTKTKALDEKSRDYVPRKEKQR